MMHGEVDYADVQGLVRFGYKRLTQASYVLVRVRDVAAARAWLRSAPITSAVTMQPPPSTAMQVAFTAAGLEALGLSPAVLAGFASEFLSGMTEASRSRRLGDVGSNAPSRWEWGGAAGVPHLVVMLFAGPGGLDALVREATSGAWNEAFELLRWLGTGDLDEHEPFGFADGISQPRIDWGQQRDARGGQAAYSNVVALGELLLGYRNEYVKYTDRPLVDADSASAGLPAAEDAPEKRDVGRNGTYLVMRHLRQDVRGFWQFLNRQTGGNFSEAERLAAAFVGRTRAGDPLVPVQQQPIPGIGPDAARIRQDQFTFDKDSMGAGCPIGAHVRRQNPRNTDYPGRPTGLAKLMTLLGFGPGGFQDDLISPVRFHRILRRGREYGSDVLPEHALAPAPPNDPERGLHFICLNANISRQFEFLQNAWTISPKFAGLTGENDPLAGIRETLPGCPITDNFTVQKDGRLRHRISGLPQFVTVRGGAYFFLPGLRALRYLAGAGASET
jgi:deferrochelatase/peroxidase EfeB